MQYPFAPVVMSVINNLALGAFDSALAATTESRLTANDLNQVVRDYGRTLTTFPKPIESVWDVVKVNGVENHWSVAVPLWTKEEGRSDLTLELTVSRTVDGWLVALDDLHVL